MRGTIDCAVLMVPGHETWMAEFMAQWPARQTRIALHGVYLHDDVRIADAAGLRGGRDMTADALARRALQLRRYDACVLPVTTATLGWTRMALAAGGGELTTPLLGLLKDMSAAGVRDLLSFGLRDFVFDPVDVEEFKTRLAQLVGPNLAERRTERQAEPEFEHAAPHVSECDDAPYAWAGLDPREPFQAAKSRLVTEFERTYIRRLLERHSGNISQAARAACKNRRAFWQLMRKHDIAADPYRPARRRAPLTMI